MIVESLILQLCCHLWSLWALPDFMTLCRQTTSLMPAFVTYPPTSLATLRNDKNQHTSPWVSARVKWIKNLVGRWDLVDNSSSFALLCDCVRCNLCSILEDGFPEADAGRSPASHWTKTRPVSCLSHFTFLTLLLSWIAAEDKKHKGSLCFKLCLILHPD